MSVDAVRLRTEAVELHPGADYGRLVREVDQKCYASV